MKITKSELKNLIKESVLKYQKTEELLKRKISLEEQLKKLEETEIIDEGKKKEYWSKEATEKVKKEEKPKPGTFTKKAGAITKELLKKAEGDPGKAVQKVNFFINRAGKKLKNKAEVMKAKSTLEKKSEAKKEKEK